MIGKFASNKKASVNTQNYTFTYWIVFVENGRGRACKMVDLINLNQQIKGGIKVTMSIIPTDLPTDLRVMLNILHNGNAHNTISALLFRKKSN
jgi:hypothetical protein